MTGQPPSPAGSPEGRREPRLATRIAATLQTTTARRPVGLINLSADGAMVEGAELPPVGLDVRLTCGQLDAIGVVRWVENGRCGLAFDEPVAASLVERYHQASRALAASPDSARRKAAKDWANGL